MGGFTWWVTAMQAVTGVLLAAHLILEDRVTGTTAHWLTRPISGGRMLAAKVVSGGLLFVLAPAVLMVPVWAAHGFSPGEVARAAGEFMAWQTGLTGLAFGFAALSKSLAQFFFAGLGTVVAVPVAAMVLQLMQNKRLLENAEAARTWWWLLAVLVVAFMIRVLLHQYFTRQTTRGWWTLAAGGVGLIALRAIAPDAMMQWAPPPRAKTRVSELPGERFAGEVAVKKIVTPFNRDLPLAVFLTVGGAATGGDFLAPENSLGVNVELPDRRRAGLAMSPGGLWGEEAAKRIGGLTRDDGPVEWDMAARLGAVIDLPSVGSTASVTGNMTLARMRGRMLAEVPLRAGASGRSGSSELRVVGLGGAAERAEISVILEERDSLFVRDVGLTAGRGERAMDQSRRDVYLLVNRAGGICKCLHIVELGSANMGAMLVSARRLESTVPTQGEGRGRVELPGWREGAVLMKVRFELVGRVVRSVTSANVALVAEEEKK
ncbi:MAG: hypothetical protein HZA93_00980 [Verrucomicrobia bacterium]|nr:hypothetical protein [Verrucomicrobiota bacterium]